MLLNVLKNKIKKYPDHLIVNCLDNFSVNVEQLKKKKINQKHNLFCQCFHAGLPVETYHYTN